MERGFAHELTGWGRYPKHECVHYRPEKRRGVPEVLQYAPEATYIPRGLGRSYGDQALNRGGGVLDLTRLDRLIGFDPETGILVAEAGASLALLYDVFLPRGFFVPVSPGTKFVTLGGAVANDIHGKNHHQAGSFGDHVKELELLTSEGDHLVCGPNLRPEIFWATVGGMGLTGVILTVTLQMKRVETCYVRVDRQQLGGLEETLHVMEATDPEFEYSVAWIDCLASGASLGRSILMQGVSAVEADLPLSIQNPLQPKPKLPLSIPLDLPSFSVNRYSVALFNEFYYRANGAGGYLLKDYGSYFYPLDSIGSWNRMYGRNGFLQYQVTFPHETALEGLTLVLEALSSAGASSFLAVLKGFGAQGKGLLSYPSPGYFLALDLPFKPSTVQLLQDLEPEVLGRGGRLYAAKDSVMSPEAFRQMYPRLKEFRAIQRELDPLAKMSSSLSRRLEVLSG